MTEKKQSLKLQNIPNIKHGFFTRNGGVSTGIYHSLNCAYNSSDNADNVDKNRDIVRMEMCAEKLATISQIHSNKVVYVDENHSNKIEADAMVSDVCGVALGILTADCVPILFADYNNNIIAAAHAGWKGAISGIIENTIAKMEDIGAARDNIIVATGPAIAQHSYEVDIKFRNNFITNNLKNSKFFASNEKDKYLFDLKLYTYHTILQSQIPPQNIDVIDDDTLSNEDKFFSYRRSTLKNKGNAIKNEYGRQISCISMDF